MKKDSLISENIGKALLLFVLPLIAGSLIQQLYTTVDAVIVGQFTGYSMPMSFLYCRIMFFMFCWDIFWKKQFVQKNADSCPDGSYRLVWQ